MITFYKIWWAIKRSKLTISPGDVLFVVILLAIAFAWGLGWIKIPIFEW